MRLRAVIMLARCALVVVVACSTTAPKPASLDNKTTTPPAPPPNSSIIDEVVRAELEHWLRDPAWLPEAAMLATAGPIVVQREIEISHMSGDTLTTDVQQVPPSALPTALRTYTLMAKDALQAEADRAGHEITFVSFDITFFAGQTDAHVGFAVRMVHPMKKARMMCCCGATDLFGEHDGHWTLTKRRGVACP